MHLPAKQKNQRFKSVPRFQRNQMTTFRIDNIQKREVDTFFKEHHSCYTNSISGGLISYIFTPSGIGTIIQIKCNVCNKIKDLTNFNNW